MAGKITWTPEREALLREHYDKMPARELGEMLGCTGKAVRQRAYVLGLTVATPGRARATARRDVYTGPLAALMRAWR